jgi:hypothetical protein
VLAEQARVQRREERRIQTRKILAAGRREIDEPNTPMLRNAPRRLVLATPAVKGHLVTGFDEARCDFAESRLETAEMTLGHIHPPHPEHPNVETHALPFATQQILNREERAEERQGRAIQPPPAGVARNPGRHDARHTESRPGEEVGGCRLREETEMRAIE